MLQTLRHKAVPRHLRDGEIDGAVYFVTSVCPQQSAADIVRNGRSLTTEDIIEIGWQLCSALQQAHNLGLSHGGLSVQNVRLSNEMQVMVVDFGVDRWMRAASSDSARADSSTDIAIVSGGISGLAWRQEVERDLRDLAHVLTEMLQPENEPPRDHSDDELAAASGSLREPLLRLLQKFIRQDADSAQPVSARDMQGRLGELLIGGGSDQIRLVDQREHVIQSRRSIVDELFDSGPAVKNRYETDQKSILPKSGRRLQFLPIITVVVALILLLLIAGLIR